MRCARCNRPITGRYVEALDAVWHPECFCCAGCGQPIRETNFVIEQGRPYHRHCHQQQFSERCAVCNAPMLPGQQYAQNFWGDTYCERHQDEYPPCYVCQRPVCRRLTNGGKQYHDGRVVCNLCRAHALDTQTQAQTLMRDVQARLARYGIDTRAFDIPLEMVRLTTLTQTGMVAPHARLQGTTQKQMQLRNGQEVGRHIDAVQILGGLPPDYLEGVLAHELGHVWLFMNRVDNLPQDLEEGLCNFFAYLLHKEKSSPEARHCLELLERNPDPLYGEGFRRVRAIYEKRGLSALLKGVTEHRRWPKNEP